MTKPDTSELKKTKQCGRIGVLKTWSTAEPNLPPEIVDWDDLILRGADGKKKVTEEALIEIVAARYSIPYAIASDAVDEAVYLGLLEENADRLKLGSGPNKGVNHDE